MSELVFIKLGGSAITNKKVKEQENMDVIKQLASEIHAARQKSDVRLLIGNGGGSYPHEPAKEYGLKNGMTGSESVKGVALTQDAAARLNRIVVKELLAAGENALSISASSCCVTQGKGGDTSVRAWFVEPIEEMLEKGLVPAAYGDVCMDVDKGCGILSTERIFRFLTPILKPSRLIIVSKHLVCKGHPDKDPSAEAIPLITPDNFEEIKGYLEAEDDATGGMLHKVEELLEMAAEGCESIIISPEPGNLERAILGEDTGGTRIRC